MLRTSASAKHFVQKSEVRSQKSEVTDLEENSAECRIFELGKVELAYLGITI